MALKFYGSPFHVTHPKEVTIKMDLSIMLTNLIEAKGWTQSEAAERLGVQ